MIIMITTIVITQLINCTIDRIHTNNTTSSNNMHDSAQAMAMGPNTGATEYDEVGGLHQRQKLEVDTHTESWRTHSN